MKLLQLLSDSGVVDAKAVPSIEAELGKPGAEQESVLQKNGVTLPQILKAKGDYYSIPTRELADNPVAFETLRFVPEESARHYRLAPLGVVDGALEVGIAVILRAVVRVLAMGFLRGELLQPALEVGVQPGLVIVDEHAGGDVHRVH